jgi:hypothetical protein
MRQGRTAPDRLAVQDVFQSHTVIIYSIGSQSADKLYRPPLSRRSWL